MLEFSDCKPQEVQRLGSLAVGVMLDRVSAAAVEAERDIVPAEMVIDQEDVSQAVELALREKDGEYRDMWRQLSSTQRQALFSTLSRSGIVDTAATRSDGSPLFSREDLYNITTRDGEQVRLMYLFAQWLGRIHP